MQTEDKIRSSTERLFEVYYALHRNNLDEAEGHLRKIHSNNLGRVSRLRYFTLAGEIKLKQQEPKAAQEFLLRGLDEAGQGLMDSGLMDQVNYLLGNSYYNQGYYVEAYKTHHSLLHQHKQSDLLRLQLSNRVGMESIILGNIQSALTRFHESAVLSKVLKQPHEEATACLGRAICYKEMNNITRAKLNAWQGLELVKNSQNWTLRAKLHNVMTQSLISDSQLEEAEIHQQKAIEFAKKSNEPLWMAAIYAVMAQVKASQTQWEMARQMMALAEATSPRGNNIYLAYTLAYYGAILNHHGHETEADQMFHRGFYYLKDSSDAGASLAANYHTYGQLLEKRGQHQQAAHVLKQAIEVRQTGRQKTA